MKVFSHLFVVLSFLILSSTAFSQSRTMDLFLDAQPIQNEITQADYVLRAKSIDLNPILLESNELSSGDKLTFTFFEKELSASVTRTRTNSLNTRIVSGHLTDSRLSTFMMVETHGVIDGFVQVMETGQYFEFRQNAEHGLIMQEIDYSMREILTCGNEQHLHLGEDLHRAMHTPDNRPYDINFSADAMPDTSHIDVMIVYTPNARTWAINDNTNIENIMAISMERGQIALDNTEIPIQINLVYSYEVDYSESVGNSPTHLGMLAFNRYFIPNGFEGSERFMGEIWDVRDAVGADFVAIFPRVNDTGGLGFVLNNPNGFPEIGYSLSRVQQLTFTDTHIHELGHNWGSGHSRNQSAAAAGPGGGLFTYSTGWRWFNPDSSASYASVMTYAGSPITGPNSIPAPVFSNPNIEWEGTPAGEDDTSVPFAPANNFRAFSEVREVLASNRQPRPDHPVAVTHLETVDFGQLAEGFESVRRFYVRNMGRQHLMISEPQVSEGFEIVTYDSTDAMPSGYLFVDVRFLNLNEGITEGELTFSTNDPDRESIEISLTAEQVAAPIAVVEDVSFTFPIDSEEEGTISIELENIGLGSLAYSAQIIPDSEATGLRNPHGDMFPVLMNEPTNKNGSLQLNQVRGAVSGGVSKFLTLEFEFEDNIENFADFSGRVFLNTSPLPDSSQGFSPALLQPEQNVWSRYELDIQGANNMPFTGAQVITLDRRENERVVNRSVPQVQGNVLTARVPINAIAEYADTAIDIAGWFGYNNQPETWYPNRGSATLTSTSRNVALTSSTYGTLEENESTTFTVDFDKAGLESQGGTFTYHLEIRTNDPATPVTLIPITLEVEQVVSIGDSSDELPGEITLSQNYPNPFNPVTQINFAIPSEMNVQLDVYNMLGQHVGNLINGRMQAGEHTVSFDGSNFASGMYIYRLSTDNTVISRHMLLIK